VLSSVLREECELKMRRPRNSDFETLSLFVILGLLTVILVLGIRWVLFVPDSSVAAPTEIHAERH
jgi:hypothetical protein